MIKGTHYLKKTFETDLLEIDKDLEEEFENSIRAHYQRVQYDLSGLSIISYKVHPIDSGVMYAIIFEFKAMFAIG